MVTEYGYNMCLECSSSYLIKIKVGNFSTYDSALELIWYSRRKIFVIPSVIYNYFSEKNKCIRLP